MAKIDLKAVAIVATFVSPGVSQGAGGFMIVGGKIVKIPPRGPAFAKLTESVREIVAGAQMAPKRRKRAAKPE